MENQEKIKVNETHICCLIKKGNQIISETKLLRFEYEDEIKELEIMAKNDNRNRFELEEYIRSCGLINLTNRFNFCHFLSSSYQSITKYNMIDFDEYKNRLNKYKTSLEERKKEEEGLDIAEKINEYHKRSRERVLKGIVDCKTPFMLNEAYIELKKDKNIVAFSHRHIGYSFPEFNLWNDFEVVFKTNFGYGGASYFFTNIKYKEIDILPYSDWIKYRLANQHEIIRYTRKHRLHNQSWIGTMDFVSELYNNSISSPETFVEKWIVNECSEMVDGLEFLLNKDENHEVVNSYFHPGTKTTLIGIELIDFKGEKISGALSFLEKIQELKAISNSIDTFIQRILSCNLSIYPILKEEIDKLMEVIEDLETQILKIEPTWKILNTRNTYYNISRQSILDEIKAEDDKLSNSEVDQVVKDKFNTKHPEFISFQKEYRPIDNEYNSLKYKLSENNSWRERFNDYCIVIEKHFNSSNNTLNIKAA